MLQDGFEDEVILVFRSSVAMTQLAAINILSPFVDKLSHFVQ